MEIVYEKNSPFIVTFVDSFRRLRRACRLPTSCRYAHPSHGTGAFHRTGLFYLYPNRGVYQHVSRNFFRYLTRL